MSQHLHEELKALKHSVVRMADFVREGIGDSMRALFDRDDSLAEGVVRREETVNRLEIEIEEAGRKIAIEQPLGSDLRMLSSVLKMNTDLERMGDLAVNISERAIELNKEPPLETNIHLQEMAAVSQKMLEDAMKAFVTQDVSLATGIMKRDDIVDEYNSRLYDQLASLIEKDPVITKTGMNLFMVGHYLERIADHACNLAEDVIYLKQGREIRHHLNSDHPTR